MKSEISPELRDLVERAESAHHYSNGRSPTAGFVHVLDKVVDGLAQPPRGRLPHGTGVSGGLPSSTARQFFTARVDMARRVSNEALAM